MSCYTVNRALRAVTKSSYVNLAKSTHKMWPKCSHKM